MLTPATLRTHTLKDLAQMARKQGVPKWHSMRKDQLVRALARLEKSKTGGSRDKSKAANSKTARRSVAATQPPACRRSVAKAKSATSQNGKVEKKGAVRKAALASARTTRKSAVPEPRDPRVVRKIQEAHAQRERLKDLSRGIDHGAAAAPLPTKDRIVLMVRDPYWLHTYWELTSQSVERAQVALAEHWHSARPTLRLLKLATTGSADGSEEVVREIEIHGAVRNWYIDVQDPPSSFRAEVGYLASHGRFHALARSNMVTTPRPGSTEMLDGNWADVADNCEKIYAMSGGYENRAPTGELRELFEERLRRPMGSPMVTRFGKGAQAALGRDRGFCFQVDAEMIVYGITEPGSYVTMAGEPVKLRSDGTFTARLGLPERRQVIPVVASSSNGVEEQTIVLAVERNTKVMELVVRDVAVDQRQR